MRIPAPTFTKLAREQLSQESQIEKEDVLKILNEHKDVVIGYNKINYDPHSLFFSRIDQKFLVAVQKTQAKSCFFSLKNIEKKYNRPTFRT